MLGGFKCEHACQTLCHMTGDPGFLMFSARKPGALPALEALDAEGNVSPSSAKPEDDLMQMGEA